MSMATTAPTKDVFQNQAQGLMPPAPKLTAHSLKRYRWRSILGIVGPILLLALYSYICFYYLAHPALNNVIPEFLSDACNPFYGWFLVSIFTLDVWSPSFLLSLGLGAGSCSSSWT